MARAHATRALIVVVMACLAGAAACGRAPTQCLAQRFIPYHAAAPFHLSSVDSRQELTSWDLGCGKTRVVASNDLRIVDPCLNGGVLAESTGPDPWFVLDVELDAAAVDAVELDGRGLGDGRVEVFWSADRGAIDPEREMEAVGGAYTTVLEVARNPRWKGKIRRLRIDPLELSGRKFNLHRLVAVGRAVDADALAGAVADPWRVDLGHEVRETLLAPPGADHRLQLTVPEGGKLRFGCGLQRGLRAPISFAVRARPEGGAERTLWSRTLTAGEAGRWHDIVVPLDALAGRLATLVLTTATVQGSPPDLARGLPLWSDPAVVAPRNRPARPNVILVSIDTLRADHVSAYGYPRRTTPNLDRWARKNAVLFEETVASAPWTLPSHASIFSGRDAVEHGANLDDPIPAGFELLAEALRDAGYRTLALTGGAFLNPRYGLDQGVERYAYWPPEADGADELETHVNRLISWLEDERDEPFFVLLHTYEVHIPYRPREPYFRELAGEDYRDFKGVIEELPTPPERAEGWVRRNWLALREPGGGQPGPLPASEIQLAVDAYDAGLAYADAQLGRLLDALAASGLDRRTLVVITADHGEALGEKGLAGHLYLDDFNLLVPLLVALPGGAEGGTRVARQVRLVDVAPTILAALGLPPLPAADGVSLLPLLHGQPGEVPDEAWSYAASTNRGLSLRVANRFKYIFNDTVFSPVRGAEQLYDLEADPGESENLAATSPRVPGLRALTRAELAKGGMGWEIDVSNASGETFLARVSTDWLSPFGVKSADLPCNCIRPVGPGTFDLRAPVGKAYTLFLPTLVRQPLRVRGRTARTKAVQFDLNVAPEDAGLVLWESLHRSVWHAGEGEPLPAAGLTIRWRGPLPGDTGAPAPEDAALKEQLKTLGYVQ